MDTQSEDSGKTKKGRIALIASKECVEIKDKEKEWYHIRKFLKEYKEGQNESKYNLYTNVYAHEICTSLGVASKCVSYDEFQTIIFLSSEIAQNRIETVLVFQHPKDLKIESVHTYALLRNCDLAGACLFFNKSVELWLRRSMTNGESPALINEPKEPLVLISHDNEKPRIMRFFFLYKEALKKNFEIIATSGTREKIIKHLKELDSPKNRLAINFAGKSKKYSHGPSGGDVIIANEIFKTFQRSKKSYTEAPIYHVIFFIDHKNLQPHQADIQVLLKTCLDPINKVNLITNSRTAEKWVNSYID